MMNTTTLEAISNATLSRIAKTSLTLVNDAREALSMRPLFEWFKGYRHMADCCPVAYALATGDETTIQLVNGTTALFNNPESARVVAAAWGREPADSDECLVVLPCTIARFTRLFDEGYYPAFTRSVVPEGKAAA